MPQRTPIDPRRELAAVYADTVGKTAALLREGRLTPADIEDVVRDFAPDLAAVFAPEQAERLLAGFAADIKRRAGEPS
jgi:hypothetical protein